MQMSDYDRWITRTPPEWDEEPDLTGLAGEAQALVDALDDALDMPCPDDNDPNADMLIAYHARIAVARDRAERRVQRRILAEAADYYAANEHEDDGADLPY